MKDAVEVWCDFTNHSCQTCVEPVKKVGYCVMNGNVVVITMVTRYQIIFMALKFDN